jgi:hypothetical protein
MKCPHCLHLFHEQFASHDVGAGPEGVILSRHQKCPGCGKSIIFLVFGNRKQAMGGPVFNERERILVFPRGVARSPIAPEVDDKQVVSDYTEAALVLADSPKASAALSRRCLQHILREKAGAKKGNLDAEIQQIVTANTLPSDITENLDAIRNIGNFAAHPMKSTSTGEIVDVEPHEAEWNLDVLEQLIDFYYVRPALAKKKRDELNSKLAEIGKPPLK